MLDLLRRIAVGVLWVLAGVGVASGLVWGATAAGVVKPLIVVSGSMEPEIMTGDLLVATRVDTADLAVGDVVSLPSELTDALVTHRIVSIEESTPGRFTIAMKGDANEFGDALDYTVGETAWQLTWQLPGMGTVVTNLTTPAVVVPLLVGLLSLLGLTLLGPAQRRAPLPQPQAQS